jgi:hemerythrin
MMPIHWDSSLEVGCFEIDAEHKLFISIIEKIQNEINSGTDKDYIVNLVSELLKYAEFHFCSEENIMIKTKYPDYIHHKKIHQKLIDELREKIFSLQYEYLDFDLLLTFLFAWFKGHTSIEDMRLAAFLKSLYF